MVTNYRAQLLQAVATGRIKPKQVEDMVAGFYDGFASLAAYQEKQKEKAAFSGRGSK